MAISGLTVSCFTAPADSQVKRQSIIGKPVWSEEPSSNTATTNVAKGFNPIFRVYSSADVWVSIGPNPAPGSSPRVYVPALTTYDIYADVNDKLAWVAA